MLLLGPSSKVKYITPFLSVFTVLLASSNFVILLAVLVVLTSELVPLCSVVFSSLFSVVSAWVGSTTFCSVWDGSASFGSTTTCPSLLFCSSCSEFCSGWSVY